MKNRLTQFVSFPLFPTPHPNSAFFGLSKRATEDWTESANAVKNKSHTNIR